MGHNAIKVVGLSERKFLLRSESVNEWKDFNKYDFDKIFIMIRDFVHKDFVLERTVWLQSTGIPMNAWLEENLKGYTKDLGEWLSWSYQKYNANDFFNPIICISTRKMDVISEEMRIVVKGKTYDVKFVEVTKQEQLVGKISPMQISSDMQDKVKSHKEKDLEFMGHDSETWNLESNRVASYGEISIHNGEN